MDIHEPEKEEAAWRALESLHREGLIRALGLSNYDIAGTERIIKLAEVKPCCLQVKYDIYHPGYQLPKPEQRDIVSWAQDHGLAVIGYSTLSGWPSVLRPIDDPHVFALSTRYEKDPASLLLRHSLQHGLAVIPSTVHKHRLRANLEALDFEIAPEDMALLELGESTLKDAPLCKQCVNVKDAHLVQSFNWAFPQAIPFTVVNCRLVGRAVTC
eukprot:6377083-Amphidinium_carterae.1